MPSENLNQSLFAVTLLCLTLFCVNAFAQSNSNNDEQSRRIEALSGLGTCDLKAGERPATLQVHCSVWEDENRKFQKRLKKAGQPACHLEYFDCECEMATELSVLTAQNRCAASGATPILMGFGRCEEKSIWQTIIRGGTETTLDFKCQ